MMKTRIVTLSMCLWLWFVVASAQKVPNVTVPTKSPEELALEACTGVFLKYVALGLPEKIWPFVADNSTQPYRFESSVTLTNTGFSNVLGWDVVIGFQHGEIIASAPDVLFVDGQTPPVLAGNGTSIMGATTPNLKNSIDTAQDKSQIETSFTLTGTEFGVAGPEIPMPANISLNNPGWDCGKNVLNGDEFSPPNKMWTCCAENISAINSTGNSDSGFLPRITGDIVMYYDIFQTFPDNYWAKVSITMESPLARLDYWTLVWDWRQGEFIMNMKGAQILGSQEQDKCVLGKAGNYYKDMDFSTVMSCSPSPTIVDLNQYQKDDPTLAVPNCCRNGTLLPAWVDSSQTKSEFQLQVYKLPPNIDREEFAPPINWRIGEGYKCGPPRPVSPSEFSPDNIHSQSAVASWQIVCNKTVEPVKKCCVSFSTFYNDSVVPCPTCACGCSTDTLPWNGQACSPIVDSMLLPYNGVLVPPSNRTELGQHLARLDHYPLPSPVPCPDNCGVAINWHIYSDYRDGWSARITLFNWDKTEVPKWFAAVHLGAAMAGFQNVYSFNGSIMADLNDSLVMQGHNGYSNDYLLGLDSQDVPGKLQSLMSFDKRKTPGINVVKGDGFPTKVWFGGDECAIPTQFPTGAGWKQRPTLQLSLVVLAVTLLLVGGDVVQHL